MKSLNTELYSPISLAVVREGMIPGVSVITEGEAKGHGCFVDNTTVAQVKEAAEKMGGTVKCKENHGTGFDAIVGAIKNFRVSGPKLLGDLTLIKSHSRYNAILEMAKTIPNAFGLSITFQGELEEVQKQSVIRVSKLYSIDLVSDPAANPNGLFSASSRPAPPSREVLLKIIGTFSHGAANSVQPWWSDADVLHEANRILFQNHISLPFMPPEVELTKEFHRLDASRICGLERCVRAERINRINQILKSK